MFFKKNELRQSWENNYGFFYFQSCQLSLMNYFHSQYTQVLEKLEMLRDLPLAQERLELYSDQLFNTTQAMSRVHQQSAQFFDEGNSYPINWNEFAQVFQDISFIWAASEVEVALANSSSSIESTRAYLSAIALGFSKIIMTCEYSCVKIIVNQGLQIEIGGLSTNPFEKIKDTLFEQSWKSLLLTNNLDLFVTIQDQTTRCNFKIIK